MKAKALVVAVTRPKIAAMGHWLVTVIYANTQGYKRKTQIMIPQCPEIGEWILINTSRTV